MANIRRKGLRPVPQAGWPLDHLFVGVATLRTMRELFRQAPAYGPAVRAWDLALWSGVSPQGSAVGLVQRLLSDPGHAPRFRLDLDYPLFHPLAALFEAERVACRAISRPGLPGGRDAPGGSATQA